MGSLARWLATSISATDRPCSGTWRKCLCFPLAEKFHPLWGGDIDAPSYIAFQQTPLQTFWPVVVGAIFLIESASALTTFEDPKVALWTLKKDHLPGNIGFDPL